MGFLVEGYMGNLFAVSFRVSHIMFKALSTYKLIKIFLLLPYLMGVEVLLPFFFFKILFIHLTEEREGKHKQQEQQAEGEGGAVSPQSRGHMWDSIPGP